MVNPLQLPPLLLGSNSPRRRELLALISDDLKIAPSVEVDEQYPASLPAHEVPVYLSRLKADAYRRQIDLDGRTLVTADTVVILDGKILGKPHSPERAVEMLEALQGCAHTVVTGVTLTDQTGRFETFAESTDVHFAPLSAELIRHYVDHYRPMDKAGAYGIQEWLGCIGIERIEGDFYNVMGLPLHVLYAHLAR